MIEGTIKTYKTPYKGLIILWVLACFLAFLRLGNLPLRDFDEATVARVAFEFLDQKGWERLLPSIWNEPYLNKPPGLHWLISLAMNLDIKLLDRTDSLPSEFSIRFVPAFLSTFVVPLGGLIQWKLRPRDYSSSLFTAGILLTLLPIVRHGRLAMLDGTQLSAIAFLWFLFVSLDNTKLDTVRYFLSGITCTFMLLLKAPLLIPAIVAALPALIIEKRIRIVDKFLTWRWFFVGIFPGLLWHIYNAFSRGLGAISPWWGDGAGRVLFDSGAGSIGSNLGFWVSFIEIIEGGWPWLFLWPLGIAFAWSKRKEKWGRWVLFLQLIMSLSILPLKMQLPWYSHPLWLPFSLVCAPVVSAIIRPDFSRNWISEKSLKFISVILFFVGLLLTAIPLFFLGFKEYLPLLLSVGISWLIAGKCLLSQARKDRILGIFTLFCGSYISLMLLMSSPLWLWELNENWDVRPVAEMVRNSQQLEVFIEGSYQRPSLNWYAKKKILEWDKSKKFQMLITNNANKILKNDDSHKCILVDNYREWSLIKCDNI